MKNAKMRVIFRLRSYLPFVLFILILFSPVPAIALICMLLYITTGGGVFVKNRVYKVLMISGTVFTVLFCSTYMIRDFTKVINFSNMSDMWSLFVFNDSTGHAAFSEVNLDDFVTPPYPLRGDSLMMVGGLPASQDNYFSLFGTETPQGQMFDIVFLHNDSLYTTTIATHTIPAALQVQVWIVVILRTLIVMGLIFVGIWAYAKRPFSSAVLTLSLFCFALAGEMTVSFGTVADVYAGFNIPVWLLVSAVMLFAFSTPLWLKLQLLFPRRSPSYARHRVVYNLLIFLPVLLLAYANAADNMPLVIPVLIVRTLFIAIGYGQLIRNYRGTVVKLEKRQIRLVMLGAAPGLMIYTLFLWGVVLFTDWYIGIPVVYRILMNNFIFLLVLGVPVSLGYAIGKYKLLHVEGKIKRGTRFLAVNISLLAVFAFFLWVVGNFLLRNLGVDSQTPILILGILLALSFMSLQRRIRIRIEEHFYPERVKLRRLLKDFLASSLARAEGDSFWLELEKKLADGLSAERIYPVIRIDGKGFFNVDLSNPTPFSTGDEFMRRLESKVNPLLFDEMIASGKIFLSPEQRDWFIQRKSAVLLPLVTNSGLLGFLVISTKTNGEDFTSEELELLQGFTTQTALVAENLELLGEKLEKEKLQEQLRVAREIQRGLLPQRIPDVPGLEIAPFIKFCLDVAGDYYDVILLDDGRVVLSIGDVSGKGVGAALIMANLQASLRTTQAMGARLFESAARINRIVYENTPPEMFITFFMLCIDPVNKCMRYVNAGHNPPLLVRGEGTVEMLNIGGLLFGVNDTVVYDEGEIQLSDTDMILMYTDGVSEAMNSAEEEYGEKRLARLAARYRDLPLDELLGLIEKEVSIFHGSDEYSDDFTLLAARITANIAREKGTPTLITGR